jgi:hypothetical protein
MLSNFQLEKLARNRLTHFVGVFPRDQIPPLYQTKQKFKTQDGLSYILNMQADHQGNRKGTHWVAMFVDSNQCYYFDSYGMKAPTNVYQFCQEGGLKHLKENLCEYQALGSNWCGEYCLFWLLQCQRLQRQHRSLEQASQNLLPNRPQKNDHLISCWFQSLIKH